MTLVEDVRTEDPGQPEAAPAPVRARRRGRRSRGSLIAALLVLAGIAVMIYPVVATSYNNMKQAEFASEYNQHVQQASPDTLAARLQEARDYNAGFSAIPILDPWLTLVSQSPESEQYGLYEQQLSDFEAMARVRVPSAGIDLPVYHGTTEQVLAKGAGHLYGTSLPVGGPGTHSVLTSHTAYSTATLFDHLKDVKEGDLIFIDVYGETLAYEVDQIKVVLPDEIGDLTAQPGEDLLTLFTCTPYAVNSHRLLVRGHAVPYTPEVAQVAEAQERDGGLEDWMYLLIGGAGVSAVLFSAIVVREQRARKKHGRRYRAS